MFNDNYQLIVGREYLSAFHKKLMAGQATKVILSGDSTTQGNDNTPPFYLDYLLAGLASKFGVPGVNFVNAGHGGMATTNWLSGYLAADLAQNPDVYILRWGINDAYGGLSVASYIANIRQGLATIRASKPLNSLSIILLPPNSTCNTAGNLAWGDSHQEWMRGINDGLRQAARDYQCCFMDIFQMFIDSQNGADWMAPDLIHPQDVANVWINDAIFKTLFPSYFYTLASGTSSSGTTTLSSVIPATLQNGWANFLQNTPPAGYYKDSNGKVYLQGAVCNGVIGSVIFNLPVGYRPLYNKHYGTTSNSGATCIAVCANGNVFIGSGGSTVWTSLPESINFRTDQ